MKFIEREIVNKIFLPKGVDFLDAILARRANIDAQVESVNYDPFLFPDMGKAVNILLDGIKQDANVVCIVDYDTDGISSGAVLQEGLTRLGLNTAIVVTDRYADGYGFSAGVCDKLLAMEVLPDILVTADLGSSDGVQIKRFQEEAQKRAQKVKVIVTDHHHISSVTPPSTADAFINPGRRDIEHNGKHNVCGAAVAWFLIKALWLRTPSNLDPNDLLDFVAVATIADMVSLADPLNRSLAQQGLAVINGRGAQERAVWQAVKELTGKKVITEDEIGFQIAPRINALSRMGDDGRTGIEFLTSPKRHVVDAALANMSVNNEDRKEEQKLCEAEAISQAKLQQADGKFVCVCYVPDYTHGVVGLAASHVVQETGLPTIVVSVKDDGSLSGSARSIPGFDLRSAIEEANNRSGLLSKFGGHAMAAGLSLNGEEALNKFAEVLNEVAGELFGGQQPTPIFYHDGELPPALQKVEAFKLLDELAPYGQDFIKPSYLLRGTVSQVRLMGKNDAHARVSLNTGKDVIWFYHDGKANDDLIGKDVEFVVNLSLNSFRGVESVQYISQACKVEI